MATIVIKDLPENTELDRQAMLAIAGGARFRASGSSLARPAPRPVRLFALAPGGSAGAASTRRPPR